MYFFVSLPIHDISLLPGRAGPYPAMACHGMPLQALPWHAMPCHSMSCHAMAKVTAFAKWPMSSNCCRVREQTRNNHIYIYIYSTHVHIHTYIYTYIYIYREKERKILLASRQLPIGHVPPQGFPPLVIG